MRANGITIFGAVTLTLAGCSSPPPPSIADSSLSQDLTQADVNASLSEFTAQMAAVYRRFGQDAKAQGYRLVFTAIGPESLERAAPGLFAPLLSKASGGGVQFKGGSDAILNDTSVRDKKTGERGVVFLLLGRTDDGQGGFDIRGAWFEKKGAWHEVRYRLWKDGRRWTAE